MAKVNNKYYFMLDGYGLMRTDDFTSFERIKPGGIYDYCITTTNAGVVSERAPGMFNTANSLEVAYNINP